MTRGIRWNRAARADLDGIDDYYSVIDQQIADDLSRKVVAAANFLAEWPEAGARIGESARRTWRVRNAPYIIVYRPHPDHVRILRVRHGRENWRPE